MKRIYVLIVTLSALCVGCQPECDMLTIQTIASRTCDAYTADGLPIWQIEAFNESLPMTAWECQSMRQRIVAHLDTAGIFMVRDVQVYPADFIRCTCH